MSLGMQAAAGVLCSAPADRRLDCHQRSATHRHVMTTCRRRLAVLVCTAPTCARTTCCSRMSGSTTSCQRSWTDTTSQVGHGHCHSRGGRCAGWQRRPPRGCLCPSMHQGAAAPSPGRMGLAASPAHALPSPRRHHPPPPAAADFIDPDIDARLAELEREEEELERQFAAEMEEAQVRARSGGGSPPAAALPWRLRGQMGMLGGCMLKARPPTRPQLSVPACLPVACCLLAGRHGGGAD